MNMPFDPTNYAHRDLSYRQAHKDKSVKWFTAALFQIPKVESHLNVHRQGTG